MRFWVISRGDLHHRPVFWNGLEFVGRLDAVFLYSDAGKARRDAARMPSIVDVHEVNLSIGAHTFRAYPKAVA